MWFVLTYLNDSFLYSSNESIFNEVKFLKKYLLWAMAMHFDGALNIKPNHRT